MSEPFLFIATAPNLHWVKSAWRSHDERNDQGLSRLPRPSFKRPLEKPVRTD
jgi:hypothetical protein